VFQVELHLAIHPVDAFVIPRVSFFAHALEALQKPQRVRTATISFNASTTGATLAAQSVLFFYNADRDKSNKLQALLREC